LARSSERIFNVPAVVLWIIVVLVLIQAGQEWLLTDDENFNFLLNFAFIPARYNTLLLGTESFPGGLGAQIWTFLIYAFLHADFIHVGVNSIWFLPFGSAMARRFGTWRFLRPASPHPSPRTAADDRRFGGGVRPDGGFGQFRIPNRWAG
jgi:membrane associated rhomboid family serine protease